MTGYSTLKSGNLPTLALGLLTILMCSGTSSGQDEAAPPVSVEQASTASSATPASPMDPQRLRTLAGEALTRMALSRLREIQSPELEDYQITALGLRLARRLLTGDAELVRLEMEAWGAAQNDARVDELNAELVRLDPFDTVAQLRLITSRVRKMQTAGERREVYGRLLGPGGVSIDASVRSRLALDAALLAREEGDERDFERLLTEATTLDVTNKQAAVLHATYYLPKLTDPRQRADVLANVMLSDPLDPEAHAQLGLELFQQGAFAAAKRFLERMSELKLALGIAPDINESFDQYILIWQVDGAEKCLARLQEVEDRLLGDKWAMNRQAREAGEDPGEDPKTIPIPGALEMLRLAIGFGRGESERVADAAARVAERHAREIEVLTAPPAEGEPGPEPGAVDAYERRVRLSRSIARLWAGVELDKVKEDLAALEADTAEPLAPDAAQRVRGWIALREGDIEGARTLLEPLIPDDPLAFLGLGVALEQSGDTAGAIRTYARLALTHPRSAAGSGARERVETLLGKPVIPSENIRKLDEWGLALAPWVDVIARDAAQMVSLTAEHLDAELDVLERPVLRVTMRNVTRHPLAVGPEAPLNSRILLTPRLSAQNRDMTQVTQPEVLTLDRRLRLMPGEALSVDVWTTRGRLGVWFDLFAGSRVSCRWRLLQGFVVKESGFFQPGSLCVTAVSDLMHRESLPSGEDFPSVLADLTSASGEGLLRALIRTSINASFRGEGEGDARERRAKLNEALVERIKSMNEFERTIMLPLAARGGLLMVSLAPMDAVRDDPSPFVKAAMIMVGFPDPNDPYPASLTEDADPSIREMATAMVQLNKRLAAPGDSSAPSSPPPASPPPSPEPAEEQTQSPSAPGSAP